MVGYFFLTFFLLSLTFERQEKAGKDRKRSKKERAREKAGIAPPARPRRACEEPCPPYPGVALPPPPLSPAVCLHARCPTRDCLTMRAVLPRFTPQGGAAAKKGRTPSAGRSSHSRQHVWLGHSARTCPRSTSSTRRTATRRCRALWAMCSMSLSVQSASACAMRSIDLAHFTPPRRPGRASAPLGPPLSACSSDSPWLTRSDSVLGRRCATERTMTITS